MVSVLEVDISMLSSHYFVLFMYMTATQSTQQRAYFGSKAPRRPCLTYKLRKFNYSLGDCT